jgi:hypothetical protein
MINIYIMIQLTLILIASDSTLIQCTQSIKDGAHFHIIGIIIMVAR